MSTPPDRPTNGTQPDADSAQPDRATGVELGMSDETGGTFEPEEEPGSGD